ncbi:efflux RND transporter periplasmic adaptor subunit [Martelella mediterranea]|uniref:Efflux pump periplasmic linker BepF n=1 Tax=Martelella mediterranea DSM 17316 TaxID=1122214 RepID=A0A1U9YZ54_9HYPH|nr:efflux RND transporter periplasmic adaptor subunit [Martelella mediterranea]AQZ50721.1 Efflux pump periplasmic linker BepF [Martelella mediterranea DSM 17316]
MTTTLKRWALAGTGLGLAASISAAVFYFELPVGLVANATEEASAPAAPPPATPVTVTEVQSRAVTIWQEFSGRLEAVDRVEVHPRVGGAIQSVEFREGALVKAGDLLFTLDPAPYEAAVAQAEGQVASAQAKVDLAKLQLDRGRRLADNRTISESEMEQRSNAVAEAGAALKTAQAALQSAQLELDYTKVKAPVSGRVGRVEITVGNLVSAGTASPALTTLVSADPIYVSFNASEEVVARILSELPTDGALPAIDQIPVEIGTLLDEGTPIKGKVQLIGNEVDAASGTIAVRAVIDNPDGRLIPGQFVRIRMGEPRPEDKILVSERAIGTDQDKKFVFVVGADNTVAYRPVELGRSNGGERIIESGLADGDRVVVNGLQHIRSGALVAPQSESPLAAAQ